MIKLPHTSPDTRELVAAFRFYEHEVGFYSSVGKRTPIGTAECFASAFGCNTGDFVLLPHENWYFKHYTTERLKSMLLVGRHGGLSPEEMLVPLLALRLG